MEMVRMYEIPACRMVSSGTANWGEGVLEKFDAWFSTQPREAFPRDYLYWNETGFCWLYRLYEGQKAPEGFEAVDFPGGLYAVVTGIDQQTDMDALNAAVDEFLAKHGMERDPGRQQLGNIITPPQARELLGYSQMDYYAPVRGRDK
ncbi:MAG: AraC family transcriptional regulator [Clostridiales bacterium]|jgi:AraC family transcriptional regulator|nr:AraC family transcriptional regulator [Clostridiales bacterium]